MLKAVVRVVGAAVLAALISACSTVNGALKAGPAPDSGFLPKTVQLEQQARYPFHRVWEDPEFVIAERPMELYIAPINTDYLHNNAWWRRDESAAADAVRDDAKEIGRYLYTSFRRALESVKDGRFKVVDQVGPETAVLEMAIVELTPTDVGRSVLGSGASVVVPGGGLLAFNAQGRIAIEGVVRRASDGRVLFGFADREKGRVAPVSLNNFSYFAHARRAIDDWAEQWGELSQNRNGAGISDSFALTLLPF